MAIPDTETTGVAFRDVLFLTLACFLIIIVLLLPHIAVDMDKKKTDDPPGTMVVEISWPPDSKTDVDLWVKSPNDRRPVGYSNQDGQGFNLLRDDLGNLNDPLPENYENAYTRGLADGEYIINIHVYGDRANSLPFDVYCAVRMKVGNSIKNIASKSIHVTHTGQEVTVFRFTLTDKEVGEIHDVPVSLRNKLATDVR